MTMVLTVTIPGLPSQLPVSTDSNGDFTTSVTVPPGTPAGTYTVYYGYFASWTITVTAPPASTATYQVAPK
jgi:hypothetical protein